MASILPHHSPEATAGPRPILILYLLFQGKLNRGSSHRGEASEDRGCGGALCEAKTHRYIETYDYMKTL